MGIWLRVIALSGLTIALSACNSGDKGLPASMTGGEPALANTYAYKPGSPVAATALRCAKVEDDAKSCLLSDIAPIAFTHPTPTKADIMERVLVSHDWMGQRFEELLDRMPDDITYLLGGVTAIVIDDDIRPSYYTTTTGAIYLDPDDLWLTQQERSVINPAPDYRAAYAQVMAFRSLWRYIIPGESSTRSIDTIETDLASLLFHELAHANDLFPRGNYGQVDTHKSIAEVINGIGAQTGMNFTLNYFSSQLTSTLPLESAQMKKIADILFNGYAASASDRQITATQVGQFFENDGANDDYAYTSQYEDLAMLFEESMMKLHYAADRDVAFANLPSPGDAEITCNDYTIGWGMRNRVGDPVVKERARWVVAKLLPNRDYSMLFDTLEEPKLIPVGLGWCTSADFENVAAAKFEKHFYSNDDSSTLNHRDLLPRSELRIHH